MLRTFSLAAVLAAALALPAMAQDSKAPAPAANAPAAATNAVPPQKDAGVLSLTEDEAKAWIGKPVYSRDGVNLGDVTGFQRGDGNVVSAVRADIGGFLGLGEHHISVEPTRFKLETDRVVLDLTASEAGQLQSIRK